MYDTIHYVRKLRMWPLWTTGGLVELEIARAQSEDVMRALTLQRHGPTADLELVHDQPSPIALSGQVVVRVAAAAFNYHDIFTVRGMPGIKIPMPVVIGLDAAGTISELGEDVQGWSVGQRVLINPLDLDRGLMGEVYDGGMAQFAVTNAAQLVPVPDSVTLIAAAALPVAYGTAHRMLIHRGKVAAGEKVLVLGASGGVGTATVLLAKSLGAYVIAAVGSREKGEELVSLGADEYVNYRDSDLKSWVHERFGKPTRFGPSGGVEVVVNFTGGDTWRPSLQCVSRGGRILTCGATAGYDPVEDLRYIWSFEISVVGSNAFDNDDLTRLLSMVDAGALQPKIDCVLPLSRAVEGLQRLERRLCVGKVMVEPWA